MPMRATPASQSTMFNGPTRSALPVSFVVEARPDSLRDRGGVRRERSIDGGVDLATVRDLAEAALGDDGGRGPAGGDMRLEDVTALCPRDRAGADGLDDRPELGGRDR